MVRAILKWAVVVACAVTPLAAQEMPYFVTYSHHMEEPGALELETKNAVGHPDGGNRFLGSALEVEYGARAWWTTEVYLEGQVTRSENTLFTGFRLENRVRPLLREHWINPVLYFEFEDINGANRSLLEIVGHDGEADLAQNSAAARAEKKREVELKLILSSNRKGWNISENIIAEKNVRHAPWEFGYALAASRPLRLAGGAHSGRFAPENFFAGAEMYGGLGDRDSFGLHDTSHYLGPVVNWSSGSGMTVSFSPNFGLNDHSSAQIYRVGLSYDLGQLSRFTERNGGVR